MDRFRLFPEQASTIAPQTDALLLYLLGVTVVFVSLIAGLILFFMIRHHRGPGDDHDPAVHVPMSLEVAWSVIPFAISMVAFFWGASLYASLRHPPADALEVDVVGKQWMWKLQHMEGRREIDELHVPLGRPVKITMTSEDVIHGFYIPDFRVKQDAIPGRYTTLWFEATRPGRYPLYCSAYCGTLHSGMIGHVTVMEPHDYQNWLSGGGSTAVVSTRSAGENIFRAQGCPSCHEGGPGARGPELAGIFGKRVQLADGGTVGVDEGYLRESILNPRAKVVAGFEPVMPTYQGLVSEEDVMQLIAYLKGLGPATQGAR